MDSRLIWMTSNKCCLPNSRNKVSSIKCEKISWRWRTSYFALRIPWWRKLLNESYHEQSRLHPVSQCSRRLVSHRLLIISTLWRLVRFISRKSLMESTNYRKNTISIWHCSSNLPRSGWARWIQYQAIHFPRWFLNTTVSRSSSRSTTVRLNLPKQSLSIKMTTFS